MAQKQQVGEGIWRMAKECIVPSPWDIVVLWALIEALPGFGEIDKPSEGKQDFAINLD